MQLTNHRIKLNEVGLRDGLQLEEVIVTVQDKKLLYEMIKRAGVESFEFGAFVHPKRVPQMANSDAFYEEVISDAEQIALIGLIPNMRGAERAAAAGVKEVNYVLSVSDTHNLQNVQQPTNKSMEDLIGIHHYCKGKGIALHVSFATTFGCPFEGEIAAERVLELIGQLSELDIASITLADTTGMANPKQVEDLVRKVVKQFPEQRFRLHFHNTRGMGLTNILAGIEAGIYEFDTALGGIGGCPFAPGATGNVCTEDVVHMVESMGMKTGTDLTGLLEASGELAKIIGHETASYLTKAGPSSRRYPVPIAK
ncbi:hydroxymethylglutaryl-CoA lyase [Planomicrobium sp. YIM 101495]|uniref:hydroxymethylglutaryl-CoA lyase n=1 Tax=Planomicrobium sp. YIM 101495 TaxID=2665160 RepID=UPI0012B9C4FA|nr:hydroxymethylglutaryl-CoA lyase [Planomicrobium sp. YIM 101495]MTD30587.1 hydroxymethylglutaryl-CoA lyase [Planomicrobium sp. YIM 101495]